MNDIIKKFVKFDYLTRLIIILALAAAFIIAKIFGWI